MSTERWTANPAYNPEKCGLSLVATVEDENACYEFDEAHVWRDLATGKLYAGHDSGCSCPTPFEDFHSLADMTPINSFEDLQNFVKPHVSESYGPKWDLGPFYEAVRAALPVEAR